MNNKEIKTEILNYNVNWLEIKNLCRNTVSMKDSSVEPTSEWKRKLLICRHSPLRHGMIMWRWSEIEYAISTHYARHIHAEKWISSSREDRTGVPRETRSQMDGVSMIMEANIEELLNISERRLCYCADPLTIEYWKSLREAIREYDEDIAWAMQPQCIVHGSCIEPFSDCKYYDRFATTQLTPAEWRDVSTRIDKHDALVKKLNKRGR